VAHPCSLKRRTILRSGIAMVTAPEDYQRCTDNGSHAKSDIRSGGDEAKNITPLKILAPHVT
jgi:hypothetical protein